MSEAQRRLPLWAVLAALFLAVLAVWAQDSLIPLNAEYWGLFKNGVDLDVYRGGAKAVLESRPLYGGPVMDDFWFTYPPFAALFFIPLSLLEFEPARTVWSEASFLALVLVLYRCLRLVRLQGRMRLVVTGIALATAATALEPVRSTFWYGQVNLVLLAVVFLDLSRPSGAFLRGFGIGLAAGIKLTSLVFLPYLLVTRQWRAAAAAAGSFAATVGLAWLADPSDSKFYWTKAIKDVAKVAEPATPANQSINGVLYRFWAPQTPPGWAWPLLVLVLGGLGLLLAAAAHQRCSASAGGRGDELLALSIVGLTGCAVSPFSWGHHWVWFVPLAAWLFGQAVRGIRPRAAALGALGFAALSAWAFMWTSVQEIPYAPVEPGYATGVFIQPSDPPLGPLGQLKAAWYPITFAVVLLVGGVVALRRSWRTRPKAHRDLVGHGAT